MARPGSGDPGPLIRGTIAPDERGKVITTVWVARLGASLSLSQRQIRRASLNATAPATITHRRGGVCWVKGEAYTGTAFRPATRSKTNSPSRSSIRTVSPSWKSPSSSASANGFWRRRWITRLSGLAP